MSSKLTENILKFSIKQILSIKFKKSGYFRFFFAKMSKSYYYRKNIFIFLFRKKIRKNPG